MKYKILVLMMLIYQYILSDAYICGSEFLCKIIRSERDMDELKHINSVNLSLEISGIPVLSNKELFQLTTVKILYIDYSDIPIVHVTAQIEVLRILNCTTSEIVINPQYDYQIYQFSAIRTKLKLIPNNLNVMKRLQKIYLHDNEIEFVDMAQLSGLKSLTNLALQRNKIVEIDSTQAGTIVFASLDWLSVEKNKLTHLNFENWAAPLLRRIDLENNRLMIANSLVESLPGLKEVDLHNNPLNCMWKEKIIKDLEDRKILVYSKKETKCNIADAVLDDLRTRKMNETFATKSQLQGSVAGLNSKLVIFSNSIKQLEETSNSKYSQLKDDSKSVKAEIQKVQQMSSSKMNQLQAMTNDLKQQNGKMLAQIEQLRHANDEIVDVLYRFVSEQKHHSGAGEP